MNLFMLALWTAAFYCLGIGAAVLAGPVAGAVGAAPTRVRVADVYFRVGAFAMSNVGQVKRAVSGFSNVRLSFDKAYEALKFTLDGETSHARDPGERGFAGRFYGRQYALIPERVATVVDPVIAAIGEEYHDLVQDKRDHEQRPDGTTAFEKYVEIPPGLRLVDPNDALHIMPSSAPLNSGERSYDFIKKAQAAYNSTDVMTVMTILMAYCTGAGVVFLLLKYGGSMPQGDSVSIGLGAAVPLVWGWRR